VSIGSTYTSYKKEVLNGAGEVVAKCVWERDAERIAAALNAQAGLVEGEEVVDRVWRAIRNAMNRNGGKPVTNDQWRVLARAALAAIKERES
jgi:hypothetical protein